MTEDLARLLAPWRDRFDVPAGIGSAVVGCSGGADSLALLALARAVGLECVAVHIDHGLRPGSGDDVSVVRAAAGALGVEVVYVAVDVGLGAGLEARARESRLAALETQRQARRSDAVLLGHTLDDQAETVLLNLLRGSGTAGLGGIPHARPGVVHPMLALGRSDTVEVCARLGWQPVHDPMNADPAYRRVWLRREVIPLLEAGTGRDLRPLLARQAQVVREESDYLDGAAAGALTASGGVPGGGRLRARPLAGLDRVLARRVVRLWLGSPAPSLSGVEEILDVAAGRRAGAELAGGRRVQRSRGWLHQVDDIEAANHAGSGFAPFDVPVPGRGGDADLVIETWIERWAPARWPDGAVTCVLDADVVGDRAHVRPAGDAERFTPLGMSGAAPVRSLLADAGVARDRRRGCAVFTTSAGDPAWLVGYRVGAHARVTPATRRYLWATTSHRPAE